MNQPLLTPPRLTIGLSLPMDISNKSLKTSCRKAFQVVARYHQKFVSLFLIPPIKKVYEPVQSTNAESGVVGNDVGNCQNAWLNSATCKDI